jgi:hypothetical protein
VAIASIPAQSLAEPWWEMFGIVFERNETFGIDVDAHRDISLVAPGRKAAQFARRFVEFEP